MVDGRPQYRMMGEGDLPIPQMLDAWWTSATTGTSPWSG